MSKFVVNDYLSLRLENGKTNIYVNNKKFIQCKYILLDIPIDASNDDELSRLMNISINIKKLKLKQEKKLKNSRSKLTSGEIVPTCITSI